jgi:hypothetical protein
MISWFQNWPFFNSSDPSYGQLATQTSRTFGTTSFASTMDMGVICGTGPNSVAPIANSLAIKVHYHGGRRTKYSGAGPIGLAAGYRTSVGSDSNEPENQRAPGPKTSRKPRFRNLAADHKDTHHQAGWVDHRRIYTQAALARNSYLKSSYLPHITRQYRSCPTLGRRHRGGRSPSRRSLSPSSSIEHSSLRLRVAG